jgi:hypothetical protein
MPIIHNKLMGSFFRYIETIERGHLMLLKFKNGNIIELVESCGVLFTTRKLSPQENQNCFNILSL